MFEEHPNCQKPNDKNIKIWRFIDFSKFISMLLNNSIYFSGIKHFGDPFEDKFSLFSLKKKNQSDFQEKGIDGKILKHNFLDMPEWFSNFEYVNCWHMNNHEPNTMWNKYAFGNRGIAIQSTYKKLRDSFVNTSESINIGIINYIDYEKTEIKWGNMLEIITHKRINFSDERELRAILVNTHTTQESSGHVKIPKDHNISVDLEELIESVIIAPSAPNWIYDLVCSILGKFSLDKPVLKSKLDDLPPTL